MTEPKRVNKIYFQDEWGNPQEFTVGRNGIVEIKEHKAQGEGDKWFYDVIFEDGKIERLFSFNRVSYE